MIRCNRSRQGLHVLWNDAFIHLLCTYVELIISSAKDCKNVQRMIPTSSGRWHCLNNSLSSCSAFQESDSTLSTRPSGLCLLVYFQNYWYYWWTKWVRVTCVRSNYWLLFLNNEIFQSATLASNASNASMHPFSLLEPWNGVPDKFR